MNDVNSLSHTSWNCKYHIVFAPKYRRYVDPFFQEEGVGTSLMKNFIVTAEMRNVKEVFLWVLAENTSAIRFYEGQGYVDTGEQKEFSDTGKFLLKYRKTLKSRR